MAKAKDLSEEVCRGIIDLYNRRMGYRNISSEFNIPISTIRTIIQMETTGMTENLIRTRRSWKLIEQTATFIYREVIQNPFTTDGSAGC